MVTAVDGLTFLADGDGKPGIRMSLSPPFCFHRPYSCVFALGFFDGKCLMVSLQHSAKSVLDLDAQLVAPR